MTRFFLLSFAVFILFSSCRKGYSIPASLNKNRGFHRFMEIAFDKNSEAQTRCAALEPIIAQAHEAGEYAWLEIVLRRVLEEYPKDPYGAYYLVALSEMARLSGSEELALDYLRRLLKNSPDLEVDGKSFHLLALQEIAEKTDDPREAVKMRLAMEKRYSDNIDRGRNLYALALDYRKIGDWDAMYETYQNLLDYSEGNPPVTLDPAILKNVREKLIFHASKKSWTVEKLDTLVKTIQVAIQTQNNRLLRRYQADGFFLKNWSQEQSGSKNLPLTIGSFLKSNIRYRSTIEDFSNDREAYLWTTGWSWKIPTWYLYFRRIDYPANPEINGRWEWAGIFFGERL